MELYLGILTSQDDCFERELFERNLITISARKTNDQASDTGKLCYHSMALKDLQL